MTDLAGQPDWAAELRKERTTLGDAQDLIALAPAVADEIERLRDLVYRTKPGTHPLLPEGQLWRDQFDIACEQWKQESLLACDLRISQDQIIARCAKAVEEKWPEAAKAIRGHVDGISGEDFGELNRELDRLRATNAALVKERTWLLGCIKSWGDQCEDIAWDLDNYPQGDSAKQDVLGAKVVAQNMNYAMLTIVRERLAALTPDPAPQERQNG